MNKEKELTAKIERLTGELKATEAAHVEKGTKLAARLEKVTEITANAIEEIRKLISDNNKNMESLEQRQGEKEEQEQIIIIKGKLEEQQGYNERMNEQKAELEEAIAKLIADADENAAIIKQLSENESNARASLDVATGNLASEKRMNAEMRANHDAYVKQLTAEIDRVRTDLRTTAEAHNAEKKQMADTMDELLGEASGQLSIIEKLITEGTKERDELRNKVKQLQSRNRTLEESNSESANRLNAALEQNSEHNELLQASQMVLKAQIDELRAEAEKLNEEKSALERTAEQVAADHATAVKTLASQIIEKEAEIENLGSSLKGRETIISENKDETTRKENQINELKATVEALKTQLRDKETAYLRKQATRNDIKSGLKRPKLKRSKTRSRSKSPNIRAGISSASYTRRKQQEKLQEKLLLAGAREAILQDQLNTLQTEMSQIRNDNKSEKQVVEQTISELNEQLSRIKQENADTRLELETAQNLRDTERNSATSEITGLKETISARDAAVSELKLSIENSQNEIDRLRSSQNIDETTRTNRIKELEEKVATLTKDLKEKEKANELGLETSREQQQKLDALQQELAKKLIDEERLHEELKSLQTEMDQMRQDESKEQIIQQKIGELKKNLSITREKNTATKQALHDLQKLRDSELTSVTEAVNQMTLNIETQTQKITELTTKLQSVRSEKAELEERIQAITQTKTDDAETIENLRRQVTEKDNDISDLSKKVKELTTNHELLVKQKERREEWVTRTFTVRVSHLNEQLKAAQGTIASLNKVNNRPHPRDGDNRLNYVMNNLLAILRVPGYVSIAMQFVTEFFADLWRRSRITFSTFIRLILPVLLGCMALCVLFANFTSPTNQGSIALAQNADQVPFGNHIDVVSRGTRYYIVPLSPDASIHRILTNATINIEENGMSNMVKRFWRMLIDGYHRSQEPVDQGPWALGARRTRRGRRDKGDYSDTGGNLTSAPSAASSMSRTNITPGQNETLSFRSPGTSMKDRQKAAAVRGYLPLPAAFTGRPVITPSLTNYPNPSPAAFSYDPLKQVTSKPSYPIATSEGSGVVALGYPNRGQGNLWFEGSLADTDAEGRPLNNDYLAPIATRNRQVPVMPADPSTAVAVAHASPVQGDLWFEGSLMDKSPPDAAIPVPSFIPFPTAAHTPAMGPLIHRGKRAITSTPTAPSSKDLQSKNDTVPLMIYTPSTEESQGEEITAPNIQDLKSSASELLLGHDVKKYSYLVSLLGLNDEVAGFHKRISEATSAGDLVTITNEINKRISDTPDLESQLRSRYQKLDGISTGNITVYVHDQVNAEKKKTLTEALRKAYDKLTKHGIYPTVDVFVGNEAIQPIGPIGECKPIQCGGSLFTADDPSDACRVPVRFLIRAPQIAMKHGCTGTQSSLESLEYGVLHVAYLANEKQNTTDYTRDAGELSSMRSNFERGANFAKQGEENEYRKQTPDRAAASKLSEFVVRLYQVCTGSGEDLLKLTEFVNTKDKQEIMRKVSTVLGASKHPGFSKGRDFGGVIRVHTSNELATLPGHVEEAISDLVEHVGESGIDISGYGPLNAFVSSKHIPQGNKCNDIRQDGKIPPSEGHADCTPPYSIDLSTADCETKEKAYITILSDFISAVYSKNTDIARLGARDAAFIEANEKLKKFHAGFREKMGFKESAGVTYDPVLDKDACIELSKFVARLWQVSAGHTEHLPQLTEFVKANKAIQMSVFEVLGARQTMENARKDVVKRTAFPNLTKKDQRRFLMRLLFCDVAAKIASVGEKQLYESIKENGLGRSAALQAPKGVSNVMRQTAELSSYVASNEPTGAIDMLNKDPMGYSSFSESRAGWLAGRYNPDDSTTERLRNKQIETGADALHAWSSDGSGNLSWAKLAALYDPSASALDIVSNVLIDASINAKSKSLKSLSKTINKLKNDIKMRNEPDMLDVVFAATIERGVEHTDTAIKCLIGYYHAKIMEITKSQNASFQRSLLQAITSTIEFNVLRNQPIEAVCNVARIFSDILSELEQGLSSKPAESPRAWSMKIAARVLTDITYHLEELRTQFPTAISEEKKMLYQKTEDIVAKMNLESLGANAIVHAVKKELTNEKKREEEKRKQAAKDEGEKPKQAANGDIDIEELKAVLKVLGVRDIQPDVTEEEFTKLKKTLKSKSNVFIHKHVNQLKEIYPSSKDLKPTFYKLSLMYHPDKVKGHEKMIALGGINDYMNRIYEEPKVKGFLEVLTKLGITLSDKETPELFNDLMEIGLVRVKSKYPTKQDLEQKRVTGLSDSGKEALKDIVERMSRLYQISAYLRALRALQIHIDASSSHAETLDALMTEGRKKLQLKCTTLKEFKSQHENAKKELNRDIKDKEKKEAAEAALAPLDEIYNMMIAAY
jgi:chromosome segregation ATPase